MLEEKGPKRHGLAVNTRWTSTAGGDSGDIPAKQMVANQYDADVLSVASVVSNTRVSSRSILEFRLFLLVRDQPVGRAGSCDPREYCLDITSSRSEQVSIFFTVARRCIFSGSSFWCRGAAVGCWLSCSSPYNEIDMV